MIYFILRSNTGSNFITINSKYAGREVLPWNITNKKKCCGNIPHACIQCTQIRVCKSKQKKENEMPGNPIENFIVDLLNIYENYNFHQQQTQSIHS